MGFLSVGIRRFRSSIPGVSEFLEEYRPDVSFLGDLGTCRNEIGRLKLLFENRVNEEWFLRTNIHNAAGYPIGSGAEFMHLQPSTYHRGIWSALLVLMKSNGRLQLVVAEAFSSRNVGPPFSVMRESTRGA